MADGGVELFDFRLGQGDLALALLVERGQLLLEVGDVVGPALAEVLLLAVEAGEFLVEGRAEGGGLLGGGGVDLGLVGAHGLDAGVGVGADALDAVARFGQFREDFIAFRLLLLAQFLALLHVVLLEEEVLAGRALAGVGGDGLVEDLEAFVEAGDGGFFGGDVLGDGGFFGGDGLGNRGRLLAGALVRGHHFRGAAFGEGLALLLDAGEGLSLVLGGLDETGLGLGEVFTAGAVDAAVLAAGVLDLLVNLHDFLLEVGDLPLVDDDLGVGLLVGAGEEAVIAEGSDGDQDQDGDGQVEAHRPVDAVPVAVQEGSGDQLADLQTRGHDHDRDFRPHEQEAEPPDGEVGRTPGDIQGGGDEEQAEAPGQGLGLFARRVGFRGAHR